MRCVVNGELSIVEIPSKNQVKMSYHCLHLMGRAIIVAKRVTKQIRVQIKRMAEEPITEINQRKDLKGSVTPVGKQGIRKKISSKMALMRIRGWHGGRKRVNKDWLPLVVRLEATMDLSSCLSDQTKWNSMLQQIY